MPRPVEFIKRSEARIVIYLIITSNHQKHASRMSEKLRIDYTYLMKLLMGMYEKGWIKTHLYNNITYFNITTTTPIKEAKERLVDEQVRLRT